MPKKKTDIEGWRKVIQDMPLQTMHGEINNETKLAAQLAHMNCEYQSLKSMFLRMREECGAEKKRAAAAEEREHKIKDVLEDIIYASTYSTDVTFEEIGKAKEICKSIYGELSYEKGNS